MYINRKFSSTNYSNTNNRKIDYIIVHYTEMSFEDAMQKLTDSDSGVSTHYLIKSDGEIFQLVDDENIAWHAGKSTWNGREALNQNSIGIEIDNLGKEEFTNEQMNSCIDLSKHLIEKYNIDKRNFIGHSDIAPERKIDPGIYFNWELCAKNGLGIWHDLIKPESSEIVAKFGDSGDKVIFIQKKLQKLGYNINVTGVFEEQTNFVARAFQSKFYPEIIRIKGIDYYFDNNSKYDWCSFSDEILEKLCNLL